MIHLTKHMRDFLRAEDGAVTVDWVVLTAGISGMGMAVTGVVSGGLESVTGSISDTLTGIEIQDRFAEVLEDLGFATLDFAGGAGGFSGGSVETLPGIGDVLQIGPGETASASFGLPDGTTEAVVEFDLFGLDSLNNEPATISINGEVAGVVSVDNGMTTWTPVGGGSTTFEAAPTSQGVDLNGNGSNDSRTQIRMTVGNPGETLDVAIHSGAGADVGNESYAIDNVSVSAS